MARLEVDRAEIGRTFDVLRLPETVVEVRIPKMRQGGTASGYFNDREKFIDATASVNGHAAGVYVTINAVAPALLARACNRIRPRADATTQDRDIARRVWIPVDFDPSRPAGISSTDAEHEAALAAARAARTWLASIGVPGESMVLANSGNGAHLLLRVDLPNDEASTRLVQRCLDAVALHCGTPGVLVDRSVYNAARIMKVYGTVAMKGDATAERPHRRAQLLEIPAVVVVVPVEVLERVAVTLPVDDPQPQSRRRRDETFDVRAWLADHGLVIQREKPWHSGATVLELGCCPFNSEHVGSAVVILEASGRLLFRCLHDSCRDKKWSDVRGLFEPARAPRSHAKRGGATPAAATDDEASFFDERGHFVPAWAGKHLLVEAHIRVGHDHRLWRYTRGVYRPDGEKWARHRLRVLVGDAFRRQQLEHLVAWLQADLPTIGDEPLFDVINCKNGLLDWRTGTLRPHSPAVLSTNQLPVAWQPDATCPTIRRFFAETLPWDTLDLVEELFGYALYPANPFRKAVLLFGPGRNGKSVLLSLFRELLGRANVSAVPLQTLGENRFAGADLFGKLANICGDLDARAIERTDLFKQATGTDVIRSERKFRDEFTFVCAALPLFSANELPRTADQTDAWFDRWIIIPMRWRFEGRAEDPELAPKLLGELEGLLVHAVAGLRRLMARRRFLLPSSVVAAGGAYRRTLDTVRGFVVEECHFSALAWTDRAALYRAYRDWCSDGGRYALAASTFNQHLVNAYGPRILRRKRVGRPGWLGLGLGPGDPTTTPPTEDGGDEGDDPLDPFHTSTSF